MSTETDLSGFIWSFTLSLNKHFLLFMFFVSIAAFTALYFQDKRGWTHSSQCELCFKIKGGWVQPSHYELYSRLKEVEHNHRMELCFKITESTTVCFSFCTLKSKGVVFWCPDHIWKTITSKRLLHNHHDMYLCLKITNCSIMTSKSPVLIYTIVSLIVSFVMYMFMVRFFWCDMLYHHLFGVVVKLLALSLLRVCYQHHLFGVQLFMFIKKKTKKRKKRTFHVSFSVFDFWLGLIFVFVPLRTHKSWVIEWFICIMFYWYVFLQLLFFVC